MPVDPDASAAAIRAALRDRFALAEADAPGVIVSDSFGRPWRNGIVNVAIGVAGLAPLADYRGQYDAAGYELHVTVLAVADELAAAAELVMHKLDARPVVLDPRLRAADDRRPGHGQGSDPRSGTGSVPVACEPLAIRDWRDHASQLANSLTA